MKKNTFRMPYAGIACEQGTAILYGDAGDYSVVLSMNNPVLQHSADAAGYSSFHQLFTGVLKILGEGYILQKQDVFSRHSFHSAESSSLMARKYHAHFQGRRYTAHKTYLIITRKVKSNTFFVYDKTGFSDFKQQIQKVTALLSDAGYAPGVLTEAEIRQYVSRLMAMDFDAPVLHFDNIKSDDRQLWSGSRVIRSLSLVDSDEVELPEQALPYREINDGKGFRNFPQDNLSFLFQVQKISCMVYNQVIEIAPQRITLHKLELKRKRHSGIPDPANALCVKDIDALLAEVAAENRLLVLAHYNVLVCAEEADLEKSCNNIEASLFAMGISCSRNAYNQLELFRTVLPGNSVELKKYDLFLTTAEAALCLFFKERLPESESSDFLIRFTDRQGIPIGIDPADLPMSTGRINNRSKFVLGGSGSGKSFFMNALLEQYMDYNFDIVIVDVGHSYSGLCTYFGGKYYTYSEEEPITMNPFLISRSEYNLEKRDFLKTLLALLFKGSDGELSQIEDSLFSNVLSAYFETYFQSIDTPPFAAGFDSFYHFSLLKLAEICKAEEISFDLYEYRYVLKKFCSGGEYGRLLNEASGDDVFSQRFIVFEIDSIRENKVLFPVVTLIIMDLVLQKMRLRTNQRKALVLEEAWVRREVA